MATFREIIRSLDERRKQEVEVLNEQSPDTLTDAQRKILEVAPITQNPIFLLSMSEPFFDAVYPALKELPQHKEAPSIHLGVAGSRNLSIMAAARSDAGIFFDSNLKQQTLIEQVIHTAKELIARKGGIEHIDAITPQDFVDAFAENEAAAELVAGGVRKDLPTTFAPELRDRTSWLYEDQSDGRFHHVMRLFAEDKIATLAMNAIDAQGFENLRDALDSVRSGVPGLENAEVGTAFLSNLPYIFDKNLEFWTMGKALEDRLFPALENLAVLGNPYLVCAKERMYDRLYSVRDADWRGRMSGKLGRENINAPSDAQYRQFRSQHPFGREFKDMTIGGYLDTVTAHFSDLREKDQKRRDRGTPVYSHAERVNDGVESRARGR